VTEVQWVFVERCRGEMRRVTALDGDLAIVTTHERAALGLEGEPDEFQLLRAAELTSCLASPAASSMEARFRRVRGSLDD
jgi:hypothetical protein